MTATAHADRQRRDQGIRDQFRAMHLQMTGPVPFPRVARAARREALGLLAKKHRLTVERIRQIVGPA